MEAFATSLRKASVSGGELAYVDLGEGPVVVLLHGFPTSSYLWRAFVPALAMSGMRALAVDLMGYGAADKPDRAPLHVRAQAGYVMELLDLLGVEECAVIGHDIGGAVAQLLALDRAVAAMVLLDSVAFDEWPIEAVRMLQGTESEQETPDLVTSILDLTIELGIAHPERRTPALKAAYRQPFSGPDGARAFFRAIRAIDGLGLAGREPDLERLSAPTLILWGEEDPYLPVDLADRLHAALGSSTLALLPGCSHLLPEDAPETIVPLVVEYLRSRYLGRGHGHAHGQDAPSGPIPVDLRPLGG
jgi:2-hydroxymuconate-semialdehyde hydrolase